MPPLPTSTLIGSVPCLLDRYGLRSLLTLLVFKGGLQVDKILGAKPKGDLKRSPNKALA